MNAKESELEKKYGINSRRRIGGYHPQKWIAIDDKDPLEAKYGINQFDNSFEPIEKLYPKPIVPIPMVEPFVETVGNFGKLSG